MSFENWQKENQIMQPTGFEAWQTENEITGVGLPTGGGLEEFGKGVIDAYLLGGKGVVGTAEFVTKAMRKIPTWDWVYSGIEALTGKEFEEEQKAMAGKIEAAREPFQMTHRGVSAQAGRILGNAVGYMSLALAGGYTAGPAGAAMVGFSIEGQDAYDNAIATGATEEQAQTERLIVGTINAGIEALQINKLMKFHKTGKHSVKAFIQSARRKAYGEMARTGKAFSADVLRHAIEEGLEEFAQEGVSMIVPAKMRDEYPKKADGSPDWLAIGEQLGAAAVGGAFAGGVLGAGGAVTTADIFAPSRKRIESAAQKIRESDISDNAKARMIGELEKLLPEERKLGVKKYKGKAFRVETNLVLGGETAADVIRYEQEELGNKLGVSEKIIKKLENVSARDIIWVTRDEKTAALYGEPEAVEDVTDIVEGGEVVAEIPDGALVLKPTAKLEIPESTRRVLALADEMAGTLRELQARRPELKEYVKAGRAKTFGQQVRVLSEMQTDDPLVVKQIAQGVAKGQLRQDYPDVAEQFSQEDWRTLVQAVNEATDITAGERMALWECLDDLFVKQKPPPKTRLKTFDKFFGTDIVTSAKNIPQGKWQSRLHQIADVMNVPKAILASFDVSMPLRQAWHYTMSHPIKSLPSWGKMMRAFCSGGYSRFVEMETRTHPMYQNFVDAGLEITKPGKRLEGEEYFQTELAHKLPGMGKIVKASERAAVTYMNNIRLQAANHFYELQGCPDVGTKEFQDIVDFVNHSTSRGGFKGRTGRWFKKWSPELGAVLWTPKMIIGKVQSITDLRKPEIRKLVACETVRAFGGATLAAMLLALGFGGKLARDPRSSDFGKVVIDKTRLDMYGTYLPMFRVIAQLAVGERKAATTGRISDVERKEVITRFLRSKLNPMAGVAWDIWGGETFLGKKMKWEGDFLAEYIGEHITPLFLQDVKDAIKYQGLDTLTFVAPLAAHGAGAATYEPTPRGDEVELKNFYAHQTYGTDWDSLGNMAQDVLRAVRPDIVKAEEKTRQAREDYTFIGKLAQEEQDAGKRVFKKLPKNIQKELDRLTVDVGGLRRRLKTDWYLNKKRYNQYQEEVEAMLKKVLPHYINSPSWNLLNDDIQQVMLQTTIDECKKFVRQKIVMEADIKDLERRG